jgi:hypothetical protein
VAGTGGKASSCVRDSTDNVDRLSVGDSNWERTAAKGADMSEMNL